MKTALILASLLASTTIAQANNDEQDARYELKHIIFMTDVIRDNPLGRNLAETPANACADQVAKLKAAGVAGDTEYVFARVGKVLVSELPARVCLPYERVIHVAEAAQLLATTSDGKQCASEMDRLLSFGIGDAQIEVRDVAFKLGDAKKTICEPIAAGLPISKEEKEKARKLAGAPYEEAGIGGGKLNVCIAHGPNLRGAGGVTLAPAKIKRASLLFVVTGPVDGVYTLQRLTFKGDEIDAVSEKTFKKAPVAADFK